MCVLLGRAGDALGFLSPSCTAEFTSQHSHEAVEVILLPSREWAHAEPFPLGSGGQFFIKYYSGVSRAGHYIDQWNQGHGVAPLQANEKLMSSSLKFHVGSQKWKD